MITLELLVGAGPRRIVTRFLQLPARSTVADALKHAQALATGTPPDIELAQALATMPKPLTAGVWNKKAAPTQVLEIAPRP